MNNQGRLYKAGLKPVFKSTAFKKWRRIPESVEYGKSEDGCTVTFNHTFSEPGETCYFAFSYPYSLEESLKQGQRLYKRYIESDTVYFHKEILTLSLEKRPMELWTLTAKDDLITEEHEPLIDGLFPYHEGD